MTEEYHEETVSQYGSYPGLHPKHKTETRLLQALLWNLLDSLTRMGKSSEDETAYVVNATQWN